MDKGSSGRTERAKERATELAESASSLLEEARARLRPVDVAVRIYERDKEAAGTLLGSALALRLFLFFVPLVLLTVGLAGILGRHSSVDSIGSTVGLSGSVAEEIDAAFRQQGTAPWFAIGVGLIGIATTGRSLSRALLLSSALGWGLGARQRLPVRSIGAIVGIFVGMAFMASMVGRVQAAAGIAVASVSYVAVAAVYAVLWLLLYQTLPRSTSDPGAALPGAALMSAVMTLFQMMIQLYMPHQVENASALYGTVGVVVATLGWFFFVGRALSLSFSVNAVIFEDVGSVSRFVFGLPGLRVLPRRIPALERFFDLEGDTASQ
jgi:membrane protein